MTPATTKSERFALAAVIAFAAVLRLLAVSDVRLTHDSFEYLDLAREIADGEFFARDYPVAGGLLFSRQMPPLFPAAVAALHLPGVPLEAAGLVVALLCDLAAVGLAFAVGRRLGGLGAGVFAGLLAAGSLQHLSYAERIITESMFGMWTLATLWAVLRTMEDPRPVAAARAGLFAAAAYLTRETGLLLVGLSAVSLAAWPGLAPRPPRAVLLRLAASFAVAFVLAALPFWIEVRARTGHFGLSLRDAVLTQVLGPEGDDDGAVAAGSGSVLARRAGLAVTYLGRGLFPPHKRASPWREAWPVRVAVNCLLLAALVLLFVLDPADRRRAALLLVWAAGFFIGTVLVAPLLFVPRYNYPAVVIAEVLAAAGLAAVARAVGSRLGVRALGAAFLVLTALLAGHAVWAASFVREEGETMARKSAARGIAEAVESCRVGLNLPARPRVMDGKIFAAYYLDGSYVPLPNTVAELPAALAAARPDVVVIDSAAVREKRPDLASLAGGAAPPGLRLGCRFGDEAAGKTISFFLPVPSGK